MKISIAFERASHVNSGTSVDPEELPWPETEGRVMRHPLLHLQSDPRGEITHYGGLVLAQQFVRRFRVAQRLDEALVLFKRHAPYHESDHVLALAYTLYADGTCLEDQAVLQGSEAVRRLVGACRIPDPTTAGDFLRRFKTVQDIEQLSGVIDEVQEAVWSKLSRKVRRQRKKHEFALVDLDGHIKPLYGVQKEGADFSYDGRWSYQPLVVSLGGSGECLKVVNQPGSARPSDAAAAALKEVLPRVVRHFRNAVVRGDSDFDRSDIFKAVMAEKAYFAIGARLYPNRAALVEAIGEKNWQPFVPRAQREERGGREGDHGGGVARDEDRGPEGAEPVDPGGEARNCAAREAAEPAQQGERRQRGHPPPDPPRLRVPRRHRLRAFRHPLAPPPGVCDAAPIRPVT